MPAPGASSGGPGTGCARRTPARRASPTRVRRPAAGSLPDAMTGSFVASLVVVLERPSGQADEDVLQCRLSYADFSRIPLLQPIHAVESDESSFVENGDAIAKRRRLGHVMCAEQNRRVVPLTQLADELLH